MCLFFKKQLFRSIGNEGLTGKLSSRNRSKGDETIIPLEKGGEEGICTSRETKIYQ